MRLGAQATHSIIRGRKNSLSAYLAGLALICLLTQQTFVTQQTFAQGPTLDVTDGADSADAGDVLDGEGEEAAELGINDESAVTIVENLVEAGNTEDAVDFISALPPDSPTLAALEDGLSDETKAALDAFAPDIDVAAEGLSALAGGVGDALLEAAGLTGGLLGGVGGLLGGVLGGLFGSLCPCTTPLEDAATRLHPETDAHFFNPLTAGVDSELEETQQWMVTTWFFEHWLIMLMDMTEQLTVAMMFQTSLIGQFLDAKHQLETQRMFQEMQARAHKKYQPSDTMCRIGTNMRSLSASERYGKLAGAAVASHLMERAVLAGNKASKEGPDSDAESRLQQFRNVYCDPADNNHGQELLCEGGGGGADRVNKDVDFGRTIAAPLTYDMDFSEATGADLTPDEEDFLAFASNYIGEPMPYFKDTWLSNDTTTRLKGDSLLLDARAAAAKQMVAALPLVAMAELKAAGEPSVQPFIYALWNDTGLPNEEIVEIIGERPSLYAQLYSIAVLPMSDPTTVSRTFTSEANLKRYSTSLKGAETLINGLLTDSQNRIELISSQLAEMELMEEQRRLESEITSAVRGTAEQGD